MEGRGEREGKEEKEQGGEEEKEKPVTCQAQLLQPAMGEWGGNTAVRTGCWALGSLEGELKRNYQLCKWGLLNVGYSAISGCFSLCPGVCRT